MGNYTYSLHNPAAFTDDEIAEGVAFSNILEREAMPEDPVHPLDQAIAMHRTTPPRIRRRSVRARDEHGTIVGSTGIGIDPEHDDNPDLISGSINVLAEHRRNGVATQLLAYFVALAKAEGRTRIISETNERLPSGEPFAASLGMEKRQWVHVNQLLIDKVDRAQLEQWVADGPVRAAGYEVFGWDNDVPEEHMASFLDAVLVMNTAPRDDLDINDFTLSADEIRESEKQGRAVGYESWQLIARRVSDGAWAGIHDVGWNPADPNTVWVGATGVHPDHRGHALGKWLKAVMTLRVMDQRPNVTAIRTGNADSNDAMLGINKAMGYEPFISVTTWEITTAAAERWLAARGVALPDVSL